MKIFLFVSLLLSTLALTSQVNKCGTSFIHNKMMAQDVLYKQKMEAFEKHQLLNKVAYKKTSSTTVYKVPVVVHVMHKGEAIGVGTNVSDAAIKSAIQALNEMFRKIPGSQGDGNGVDVNIEYVLAVRSPSGTCTNGINRINMSGNPAYMSNGVDRVSTGGISDAALKATSFWNQNQYYNIWLISEIDDNNGGSGIQGYAYFASSHGTSIDGTVILANNFIKSGSTTAAHEIGHSLNLYHTFEGDLGGTVCPSLTNGCGSNQGDCCADTPPHKQSSSDCVSGTNACNGGSTESFIHNYMDYSSDACQNMFTADQKSRMVAALTTDRASFLASNGNLSLVPPSIPGVDFTASGSVLCGIGQTVEFLDKSTCIPNSYISLSSFPNITHLWTITNGINTYTSNVQNPTFTFTNTGTYNVSLSVTNGVGTSSLTNTEMIIVTSNSPTTTCVPSSTNLSGNYWQTVYNTTFNNINSTSSQYKSFPYIDLSCVQTTTVRPGNSYSLSISAYAGGANTEYFEAYIDYNNDGVYTNPSEMIFSGSTPSNSLTGVTSTTNITIPTNAVENTLLRMRVFADASPLTNNKRNCTSPLFVGDVEDYGVYIMCSPPTITSFTPSTRCGNGTVTLKATASSGTVSWYSNSSGGSSIATGTLFTTPTLTSNTVYYVDATNTSCTTPARTAISASIIATPNVTLTPSASTICLGQNVIITASGATSYTWLPSGSSSTSTLNPIALTVYTVSGSNGSCTGLPKTTTVNVSPLPTITLTPSTATICSGQNTNITASGATSYTWLPSGSSATSTLNPITTTIFTVTGSNGTCTGLAKTATVAVIQTPTITLTPNSSTICAGQNTTINASGATSYTWLPTGSSTTSTLNPITATVYSVSGSNGSCTGLATTATIEISQVPIITLTPITSTICSGQNAIINASGATSYTWLPSGFNPTTATVYTVTGGNGSCLGLATTATVEVNQSPNLNATASTTLICENNSAQLTATGASNYTWAPTQNLNVSSGDVVTASPTITTVYTVTGTSNNCSKSYTLTLNVDPCTALKPLSTENNIKIYPNPNNGIFTISSIAIIDQLEITITNAFGQIVKTEILNNLNQTTVDMSAMSKGIYYIKVTSNETSSVYKLMID